MDALAELSALQEAVRAARADGRKLRIQGGGSKAFLTPAAQADAAALDVRPLAGISSYEPSELVVTARAGTPLAEVQAVLAEQGQWLPFEPPAFSAGGTLGGMVAAGLSGPARAAVGSVRDYVLGATALNGRAELLSFGGQVMKNVAGYDLSRLLAGSWGCLGVICEVSLKVLPCPPSTATLRFDLALPQALEAVNRWAGQPLPLNASAWWNGTLVLRLSGAEAAVASAGARLGGEPIAPDLAAGFWQGLRDQHDEFFLAAQSQVADGASLWRLSVPGTAPALALEGDTLVEWFGAQRWLLSREPEAKVQAAAAQAGGHAAVWRGPGRGAPLQPVGAAMQALHSRIKASFDPEGVFNPGFMEACSA